MFNFTEYEKTKKGLLPYKKINTDESEIAVYAEVTYSKTSGYDDAVFSIKLSNGDDSIFLSKEMVNSLKNFVDEVWGDD